MSATSQGCVRTGDRVAGCPGRGVSNTHLSLEGLAQALLGKENKGESPSSQGSNPGSATYRLIDLGQGALPPSVSVSQV